MSSTLTEARIRELMAMRASAIAAFNSGNLEAAAHYGANLSGDADALLAAALDGLRAREYREALQIATNCLRRIPDPDDAEKLTLEIAAAALRPRDGAQEAKP